MYGIRAVASTDDLDRLSRHVTDIFSQLRCHASRGTCIVMHADVAAAASAIAAIRARRASDHRKECNERWTHRHALQALAPTAIGCSSDKVLDSVSVLVAP